MGEQGGVRAWRAMLLAHNAALRAIDAELSRAGCIPLTWYDVLVELDAAPDDQLRMQDLAARVVLSRTRVSRLADEMMGAGLLTKSQDEMDRRVVWATITDRGARELSATAPVYMRGIERHFASYLDVSEQDQIAVALGKVADAHSKAALIPLNVDKRWIVIDPPGESGGVTS
jgi:DNA-binding MarR family transcriptional regulator